MDSRIRAPWIVFALGASTLHTGACTSVPLHDDSDEPAPVILAGDVTVTALNVMMTTPVLFWEWSAGLPLTPAPDSVLPATEPVEFTWTTDLIDLDPVVAGAVPLTGVAFLMRFWAESDPTLLNVFTTLPSFTPDHATWELLARASQPVTVRIDSADFEANQIVEDRGPFYGRTLSFSVESSSE